jgi:hypothetical protein
MLPLRNEESVPRHDPWLEEFWQDVHATLLVYARDQLNAELPPGLQARVDERLAIAAEEGKARTYVPDVAIAESWDRPSGPVLGQEGARVAAAEPPIVDFGEEVLRRLEIVDSRAHVITAIEVLSPSNKADLDAVLNCRRERNDYLRGGISIVEIDLLRGGTWILPDRSMLKPVPPGRVCYHACVTRPPWWSRHEFYVLPLRERLPTIRVPLRRTNPDVALDLQLLIDDCYERGRHAAAINYAKALSFPLPDDESAWARDILASKAG